ncbi:MULTISPECIES: biotin carboxylase N-terminal domain-containing protein [Halomonadaceae]|uniref:ATP-binding protein n=1 Tax=Halomonadaceae TaxID=28256 RepID=UPI001598CB99|nr:MULTISPECIES: biotin carboxylase N-terminal domain-containing protein [unclassified Halomonas]QJQ94107.1 ATP-grasp domain-containing protein [Halomonas sp. PA5]
MFQKLLIANRGEIAVRIERACAEMGIRSVAIYTEADRFALHVKRADEAYFVGDDPLAGYLDAQRLVDLARETGCDAIHPGYGFLAESADLSRLCSQAGIAFIGPGPDVIAAMSDRSVARDYMRRAGIPVIAGSQHSHDQLEQAQATAASIGYPVMLKSSGSAGKHIRRCDGPASLARAWQRANGDDADLTSADLHVEKCVEASLHIEVQVLADRHGGVIHLFERDCSIQRHNRKLIDIAPSPHLTPEQRSYVGRLAIRAAQAVSLENAGTIEFLVKGNEIYFLAVSTRIEVEHTVTEATTGVDIVREQIRISHGHKLSFRQEDIHPHGYAMQFRINAEDPRNDFLPSFGRVTRYYSPGGPGVRTDTAIYTGYLLPPHFGPLCLKLIVWGMTWEEVLNRGVRTLNDMRLQGIKTSAPYYEAILLHPDFREKRFDTDFVARHPELLDYSVKRNPDEVALVIAAAIAAHAGL